jgi:hypothetical protein
MAKLEAFIGEDLDGESCIYIRTVGKDGSHLLYADQDTLQGVVDELNSKVGWIDEQTPDCYVKAPLGVCAQCREDIYSMNHVIVAKDGALFHGRCWRNV